MEINITQPGRAKALEVMKLRKQVEVYAAYRKRVIPVDEVNKQLERIINKHHRAIYRGAPKGYAFYGRYQYWVGRKWPNSIKIHFRRPGTTRGKYFGILDIPKGPRMELRQILNPHRFNDRIDNKWRRAKDQYTKAACELSLEYARDMWTWESGTPKYRKAIDHFERMQHTGRYHLKSYIGFVEEALRYFYHKYDFVG